MLLTNSRPLMIASTRAENWWYVMDASFHLWLCRAIGDAFLKGLSLRILTSIAPRTLRDIGSRVSHWPNKPVDQHGRSGPSALWWRVYQEPNTA